MVEGIGCVGSAECSPDGPGNVVTIHRDPAADLPERITALNLPARLCVVEDRLVRPELAGNSTSCFVKCRPELICSGVRIKRSDMDGHDILTVLEAKRTLTSKVTASGAVPTSRIVGSTWRAFGPIKTAARIVAGTRTAWR